VESALRKLPAYAGGKLPVLEGFVAPQEQSLDRYQRGYYQYSVQVTAIDATRSRMSVRAKITAWYAGENGAGAGYRALPSNGRLESDLLEQLAEVLHPPSATTASAPANSSSGNSTNSPAQSAIGISSSKPLRGPIFSASRTPALPTREQSSALNVSQNDEKRLAQLRDEAKTLEDTLHGQARPDNLAVVKDAHAPVLTQPLEGSKPVMYADAEDEFQIVDAAGAWVHVQISGLSRGWIQRAHLDVEHSSTLLSSGQDSGQQPFHETRTETSTFPGDWEPLRGKQVKIVWVQPTPSTGPDQPSRLSFAKLVFRREFSDISKSDPPLAGVVVVFDSQDGGMAAAPFPVLQQWHAGHLSDAAFLKRCWLDPAEAFRN
jgi:hypothetical protein